MRKSIMLVHDAFSVKINSFLTSKDKMAAADKEKSAGILIVRRAFLTQSDVGRLFFEAMIPYERSPKGGFFVFKKAQEKGDIRAMSPSIDV